MKGEVNGYFVIAVGVIIISVLIFVSGRSVVDNMVKDKQYFEAKLTLLGIRDNMILASTLDSGEIRFTSFGSGGKYEITIDNDFISLKKFDDDGEASNMPPVAPLPHYIPEAIRAAAPPPYVIEFQASKDICVIKRQSEPACGPEVEVCEATDAGCSCAHSICK